MQRQHLIASILMLAAFLAACASNAERQDGSNSRPVNVSGQAPATETSPAEDRPSLPPADCPITAQQDPPFVPPPPYEDLGFEGEFWYGSNSLWTSVPKSGVWLSLPEGPVGYSQKIFWWRQGYVTSEEPQPDLAVTGERLDAKAPPLQALRATNASAGNIGSAMLTGVEFPTPGCWRITGNYGEAEASFVVWIAP